MELDVVVKIVRIFLVFCLVSILLACGGAGGSADTAGSAPAAMNVSAISLTDSEALPVAAKVAAIRNNLKGYPLTSAIWPSNTIKVCWLMGDAQFDGLADARGCFAMRSKGPGRRIQISNSSTGGNVHLKRDIRAFESKLVTSTRKIGA
jgi:hypothetical protein